VVLCPPFFDPQLSQDLDSVEDLSSEESGKKRPLPDRYMDDYRFSAGVLIEAICEYTG